MYYVQVILMCPEIGIPLFNNKKYHYQLATSLVILEVNIENISSQLGSRLANCGNKLELRVLTQLHHVH